MSGTADMKDQTTRNLAFSLFARGKTRKEVAEILEVSVRTISRWRAAGNIRIPKRGPRFGKRRLTLLQEGTLIAISEGRPATSFKELCNYAFNVFGICISLSTAARVLSRAAYTHKKAVKRNTEYSEERGRHFVRDILRPILMSSPSCIASIDEAGFHLNCAPKYGWAKKGARAVITRPMVRGQKFSLLLCVRPTGTIASLLVEGAITSVIFRQFLETLPQGLTLISDNCSIHKATKSLTKHGLPTIRETADSRSITLQYAVPYGPYLNPVEYMFQSIRQRVNKEQPRNASELHQAISNGIAAYSPGSMHALFQRVVANDGRVGA